MSAQDLPLSGLKVLDLSTLLPGPMATLMLADAGAGTRLVRHGILDEYSLIAPPTHLYAHYKLDAAGIGELAQQVMAA